jgi:glutamyl-tRNA reductase
MILQVVGCSHQDSSLAARERLAFSPEQAREALSRLRSRYPDTEAVLLSTCNRVELYFAATSEKTTPTPQDAIAFLADFHALDPDEVAGEVRQRQGEEAIRHLFTVAASLDSMVVGEAQILSQVKQAYELATAGDATGPLTHAAFQAALRVAKRVAHETAITRKRVSIPSVAVADFAKQLFERFDDKRVLVIGAGEMGEETLRYLIEEGAREITIVNRRMERATQLAQRLAGHAVAWEELHQQLVVADLVICTTGAGQPILGVEQFRTLSRERSQRILFILDLAVPRDVEPAVGEFPGVYLYSIDDLQATCEANRRKRQREWPKAQRIIDEETKRFVAEWKHRATAPAIRRLKAQADQIKSDELTRLFNRLNELDDRSREEVERAFDRLVNKILHPPLESLRLEADPGTPHTLLDALKRLFQIQE